MRKQIGIIGLGRMGSGLAHQWLEKGWRVVGYNRSPDATKKFSKQYANFVPAYSIEELARSLSEPRVVWVMVPKGAVDENIFGKTGLARFLERGDTVIDGGNSFYKDSITRAKKLERRGIKFIDVGVSGGPAGARNGACLMIGGKKTDFKRNVGLFKDVSLPRGYKHFEGAGAGHFVKMVHNGIEYGMMQAIAEGFAIIKESKFKPNLVDVADIYQNGSVVTSRLVGWLMDGLKQHGQELRDVSGVVGHTGEGAWTVKEAKKLGISAKVIEESFKFRVQSEKNPSFTGKLLSVMREQFGGHNVRGEKKDA